MHMKNSNSYNADLYTISSNIYSKESFSLFGDSALSIHNALLPFYKYLTGEYASEKSTIKYAMPIIDFEKPINANQQKLFEFYLDYMRNSNDRKVKNNSTKIDLTANTELTDKAMARAEEECNVTVYHQGNNVEFYKKLYAHYQQTARLNITTWEKEYIKLLKQHSKDVSLNQILIFRRSALEKIFSFNEILEIEHDFGIWKDHYHTQLYIDLSCYSILQTVTNALTNKRLKFTVDFIQPLNEVLDNLTHEVEPVKCSENAFMTYSEFLLFFVFRTHFLEDIDTLKFIVESSPDIQNPKKEYSLITDNGNFKKILPSERYHIYLEGEEKYKRSFNSNFKKCNEFVDKYNHETGRKLKQNDITLKAIYRQIILEKTTQNRRQSKTIMNDFLKNKKFRNLSEYYFINEKINLGMYREYGLFNEFLKKNEFQQKLYAYINILLTRLNPSDILKTAREDFNKIYFVLESILSEYNQATPVNDIENFLSTMPFYLLNEPKPDNNNFT